MLVFSALLALFGFLFLEIVARATAPTEIFVPSDNFRLIYELNPRYPGINSLGMRQDEFDRSSLIDHFVIAVIGDSHTYSIRSDRWEHSFPAQLEQHLRELTGKNIKVLNFGVPGYNMAQELETLKAKALTYRPDLVILQHCINDDHISNFIQPEHVWLNRALHQSEFLTRVWKRLLYSDFGQVWLRALVEDYVPDLLLFTPGLVGTAKARETDPARRPHPPRHKDQVPVRYHDFIGRENLERDVRVFGDLVRQARVPALATGFIEERDKVLYEASGFRVYTFLDIFGGLDMRDYGYDPNNTAGHFTDEGSAVIGRALARFIAAHAMSERQ